MKDAKKLWEWLKNKGYSKITPREVQQRSPLRNKTKRDNALEILISHQLIRVQQENNKSILELNPYSS